MIIILLIIMDSMRILFIIGWEQAGGILSGIMASIIITMAGIILTTDPITIIIPAAIM
jgi:hypothetical protein